VALASNANLGPNETEIDSNVNTIRAHEAAKAAIIAKKKVDSEKQKIKEKEKGQKDNEAQEASVAQANEEAEVGVEKLPPPPSCNRGCRSE
jgi:hypothetical protein